jgi:hypothetical protein
MRTALLKAMRWFIVCFLVMGGTTALMIAEKTGGMTPVIFGVLGYGFAYVMTALWKEMKGKPLAWGMGVFIVLTNLSPYVGSALYLLFGLNVEINPYVLWIAMVLLVGVPVMTYIYRRID